MSRKAAKKGDEEYDDDSENDSDYNPLEDKDAQASEEEDNTNNDVKQLSTITYSRKRKVDDMWSQMQEEAAAATKPKAARMVSSSLSTGGEPSNKKKKKQTKALDILSSIFGKGQSMKLLNGVCSDGAMDSDTVDIKELARESVKKLVKKEKVTETRKFAGQEITYVSLRILCLFCMVLSIASSSLTDLVHTFVF